MGELAPKKRLAFREFQPDPARLIEALRAIWRADEAAPAIEDFFPEEN